MAQNIYDNPDFFAAYSRLPRSVDGQDAAPEWPALRAQLPDMAALRVLDLGCGFGWFSRWARERGAARVLGLDVSENMLARARAATTDPAIVYARQDLDRLDLNGETFDLAYSSLVLHYLTDLGRLFATVHAALSPRGCFVFSMEHPILTAPANPGWVTDARGRRTWPIDGYLNEGPRTTDWLAKGVVKRHRTLGSVLTLLIRQGFDLTHVEEWGPTEEQVAAHPEWGMERERPIFLLVAARRSAHGSD